MRERRQRGDVPIGDEVPPDSPWRKMMHRFKDALLLFAVAGGIVSGVGFILGPILGKRIADSSREQLNAQEIHLHAVDSVIAFQGDSLRRLSIAVERFAQVQGSSVYLQCEMYRIIARGGIKPEVCKDARP